MDVYFLYLTLSVLWQAGLKAEGWLKEGTMWGSTPSWRAHLSESLQPEQNADRRHGEAIRLPGKKTKKQTQKTTTETQLVNSKWKQL